jgi:hypothetical protein
MKVAYGVAGHSHFGVIRRAFVPSEIPFEQSQASVILPRAESNGVTHEMI